MKERTKGRQEEQNEDNMKNKRKNETKTELKQESKKEREREREQERRKDLDIVCVQIVVPLTVAREQQSLTSFPESCICLQHDCRGSQGKVCVG